MRTIGLPRWAAAAVLLLAVAAPGTADEDEKQGWRFEDGLGFESKKHDFKFTLTGYVQGDFRSFRGWDAGDDETGLLRADDRELRRLRTGFEAEWKKLSLELDVDPRTDEDHLKDAYAEYAFKKAFHLRAGHFKLPISLEFLTSAAKTDFVERTLLATHIGPARDWGVMALGEPHERVAYQLGVFAGDGRTAAERAETTVVGRVVVGVLEHLDLGASYAQGDVEQDADLSDPRPKGFLGESPTGYEFYQRHHVHGTRRRFGADALYRRGPVALRGEWLRGTEERRDQGAIFDDLPDQVATGWSASVTWLVTGEKKRGTVEPERPLFHGPGAVEVGLRYEALDFDDDGPDEGFEGVGNRARNIRPAGDRIFTGGVSWWPRKYLRLMGNVVVERYRDPLLAPEPPRKGNYVTLLGRLQFQLP